MLLRADGCVKPHESRFEAGMSDYSIGSSAAGASPAGCGGVTCSQMGYALAHLNAVIGAVGHEHLAAPVDGRVVGLRKLAGRVAAARALARTATQTPGCTHRWATARRSADRRDQLCWPTARAGRADAALNEARLLTLTGVGGVGKTRLALALGERVGPMYPDGIWRTELASLSRRHWWPRQWRLSSLCHLRPAATDPLTNLCPCPHWGFLIRRRMRVVYADRQEVLRTGDLFYLPQGHTGLVEEDFDVSGLAGPRSMTRY